MNKILNVNVGGYALTIDDDAFEYLDSYITNIRRRFSESEGRDEILHDIESRLGELLTENLRGRSIVMLPDVEAAIQVMGKPEDFGGAEPTDNQRARANAGRPKGGAVRTGKRLFRDEEDSVAGGVCSGMSAYFGIADPVWMRLIFVLLAFLSFGFWVPGYILMWILLPAARTAADRLSMRGEPINVDNIAREVEDGFDRIGHRVSEFGADAKKKTGSAGSGFAHGLGRVLMFVGGAFALFVRFLAKFGIFIAALVCIALFFALLVSWVAGAWTVFAGAPVLEYFSPLSSGWTYLGLANLFFTLGLPILGLCLIASRALFKTRTPRWLSATIATAWFINLFSLVCIVGLGAKGYRSGGTVQKTIDLSGIGSDTLRVEQLGDDLDMSIGFHDGPWGWWEEEANFQNGNLRVPGDVEIKVRRSSGNDFRLIQTTTARGANSSDATHNAESIGFDLSLAGNRLKIPLNISLQKGQRWRGHRVRLTLEMPAGKFVRFDDRIYHHASAEFEEYADRDRDNYISRSPNRLFKMTRDGLVCADCPEWGDRRYRGDQNFEEYILEGNFDTEFRHGDEFSIEIEGSAADKALLKSIRTGNKLTLTTEDAPLPGKVRVTITTPNLNSVFAKNTGDINLRGFDQDDLTLSVRGNSNVRGYVDVNNLNLSLSGKCRLDLTGSGNVLTSTLTDGATLESIAFQVDDLKITASDGSTAKVNVKGRAEVKADAQSNVKVEGGAELVKPEHQD